MAAFAVVSLSAVGLVAVLASRAVQTQTVHLEAGQRARAEVAIVSALAHAYLVTGGWERADLTTARALAQAAGLQVVVLNAAGGPVASLQPTQEPTTRPPAPSATPSTGTRQPSTGPAPSQSGSGTPSPSASGPGWGRGSPGFGQSGQPPGNGRNRQLTDASPAPGSVAAPVVALVAAQDTREASAVTLTTPTGAPTRTGRIGTGIPVAAAGAGLPVVVDGATVGRALIEAAPQAPVPAEAARRAILRTVGWAVLAASVLAVLVSVLATRRVTEPLVALAAAARAVEHGDPDPSRLLRPGPGELGEVSAAFAHMAASVRRTDELRRTMAADVAHELRTPVTILRGSTEEMLDGLAPVTREAVASLHEEVLRLERLVEDLGALSAAQAAGLSLRPTPVDLAQLSRRAVAQLRTRLAEAEQTVTVTGAPDGRAPMVYGDPDRLTQVMTNLLVNAIAHTPPGGGIGVDIRRRGDQIALTVTDTGRGIPPAQLPYVFERFYRGTEPTTVNGTGIGLAVVAELVSAHGGTVDAASPPGQGAVFTVLLPADGSPARPEPDEGLGQLG